MLSRRSIFALFAGAVVAPLVKAEAAQSMTLHNGSVWTSSINPTPRTAHWPGLTDPGHTHCREFYSSIEFAPTQQLAADLPVPQPVAIGAPIGEAGWSLHDKTVRALAERRRFLRNLDRPVKGRLE